MLDAAAEIGVEMFVQLLIEGFENHVAEFGDPNKTEAVTALLQQTKASLLSVENDGHGVQQARKNIDTMIPAVEDISDLWMKTSLKPFYKQKTS